MIYSLYFPPNNFKRHIKSLNKNYDTSNCKIYKQTSEQPYYKLEIHILFWQQQLVKVTTNYTPNRQRKNTKQIRTKYKSDPVLNRSLWFPNPFNQYVNP